MRGGWLDVPLLRLRRLPLDLPNVLIELLGDPLATRRVRLVAKGALAALEALLDATAEGNEVAPEVLALRVGRPGSPSLPLLHAPGAEPADLHERPLHAAPRLHGGRDLQRIEGRTVEVADQATARALEMMV